MRMLLQTKLGIVIFRMGVDQTCIVHTVYLCASRDTYSTCVYAAAKANAADDEAAAEQYLIFVRA